MSVMVKMYPWNNYSSDIKNWTSFYIKLKQAENLKILRNKSLIPYYIPYLLNPDYVMIFVDQGFLLKRNIIAILFVSLVLSYISFF